MPDLATLFLTIVLGLVLALTGGLAARRSRRDAALRVLVVLLDFLHRRRVDHAPPRPHHADDGRRGQSR